MMPRIGQKPMMQAESPRPWGLPSHDAKAEHFDALEAKRLEEAAVKAGTGAPLRPPVPTPTERRKQMLDEVLGFPQRSPDPVDAILAGQGRKFTEPVPLRPPGAALALDGTQERLELADRPRRSVDEILFGTRMRLR
jgi:hypothetical protein